MSNETPKVVVENEPPQVEEKGTEKHEEPHDGVSVEETHEEENGQEEQSEQPDFYNFVLDTIVSSTKFLFRH
jgi:hypothetical protein